MLTAKPDSGYFKILLRPGNAQPSYTVNNVLIGCSAVPLSEWNWYQNASSLAGMSSVWTNQGWQTTTPGNAALFQGLYFYRVVLNNVQVLGQLGVFLSSQGRPATVAFFTRIGIGYRPASTRGGGGRELI